MLQFITHETDKYSYLDSAILALNGGCKWIQLRMKHSPAEEIMRVAGILKEECRKHDAILIIDDHVDIAMQVDADGVHLGKNDMPPAEARVKMGEKYIIGGTANTFDDIRGLVMSGVDYIGLGPYRFTTTKERLSPVLGDEGYRAIMEQCRDKGYRTPVVAIGGITFDDIVPVMDCGVSGIAVSGGILNADDPVKETERFLNLLYRYRDGK
ncbi:MAG: thiamine phosphate synthase [Bacteroidetes bacterium]|uniref:Thiamine-phosphate synthase n=1 Tax=Candidatus Caccoplasma merdipullorum TaxID=2840718 RepID=A0A9D9H6Y6_9BACT|nr:thiamine phosphate synthase [Candidatus Caccoplasma merdipullorum]